MLTYLSVYLVAAVLLFQGVNLLWEQSTPTSIVPGEVRPAAQPASRWGGYLVGFGALLTVAALFSHAYDWLVSTLVPLRNLGLVSMALYGLWLVFGRQVNYLPAAPVAGETHGHGH